MREFDRRGPVPDSHVWPGPDEGPPPPLSSQEASEYQRTMENDRRRAPGPRPLYDRATSGANTNGRRPPSPPRAAWVMGLAALAVCVGLGFFLLLGRQSDDNLSTTGALNTLPAMGTSSTAAAGELSGTTELPVSAESTSPPQTLSGRVSGSQIQVEGEVPSTQAAAALRLLLEQVMGVGNVETSDVVVNNGVPAPDRINMIVDSELVFPIGSAQIQQEFLPTLDRIATLMMTSSGVTTVVEGHADAQGQKAENLSLSQQRADAVVAYLESKGIESTRLTPVGKGSTEPIADNSTTEGRRQNRRIEFSVQGFRLDL